MRKQGKGQSAIWLRSNSTGNLQMAFASPPQSVELIRRENSSIEDVRLWYVADWLYQMKKQFFHLILYILAPRSGLEVESDTSSWNIDAVGVANGNASQFECRSRFHPLGMIDSGIRREGSEHRTAEKCKHYNTISPNLLLFTAEEQGMLLPQPPRLFCTGLSVHSTVHNPLCLKSIAPVSSCYRVT